MLRNLAINYKLWSGRRCSSMHYGSCTGIMQVEHGRPSVNPTLYIHRTLYVCCFTFRIVSPRTIELWSLQSHRGVWKTYKNYVTFVSIFMRYIFHTRPPYLSKEFGNVIVAQIKRMNHVVASICSLGLHTFYRPCKLALRNPLSDNISRVYSLFSSLIASFRNVPIYFERFQGIEHSTLRQFTRVDFFVFSFLFSFIFLFLFSSFFASRTVSNILNSRRVFNFIEFNVLSKQNLPRHIMVRLLRCIALLDWNKYVGRSSFFQTRSRNGSV